MPTSTPATGTWAPSCSTASACACTTTTRRSNSRTRWGASTGRRCSCKPPVVVEQVAEVVAETAASRPSQRPSLRAELESGALELQVRHPRGVHRAGVREPRPAGAEAFEQALTRAEEDRCDAEIHHVDEIRRQVLARRLGSARERDILVPGRFARLLERRLDSSADEGELRALQRERLSRMVREDEDRMVERRLVAPPAVPRRIGRPWTRSAAEHVPAHDRGADVLQPLLHDRRALVDDASLQSVRIAPDREREHPRVQVLATDP